MQRKAGPGSHVERLCVLLSAIETREEAGEAEGAGESNAAHKQNQIDSQLALVDGERRSMGFESDADVEAGERVGGCVARARGGSCPYMHMHVLSVCIHKHMPAEKSHA